MREPRHGLPRLIRRISAPHLVLNILIAFGTTVLLVRLFLELTGYPQLGNSTLHIAHMLYGGIILAVACLLMIIFASPTAIRLGAILTGIGLGLFFDEVGKFITANNDYFFRPAAPIIYLVAIGIALLFLLLRRREQKPTDGELMVEALENTEALLEGQQTVQQHRRIELSLDYITTHMQDPDHANLAQALRVFTDSEAVRAGQSRLQRYLSALELKGLRYFIAHQDVITYILLALLALNSLSSLFTLSIALILPTADPGLSRQIQSIYNTAGLRAWSPFLISIDDIDLLLDFITATMTLAGIILFLTRRRSHGLFWVQLALFLQLCVVNVFTFYVEQFSAAILTLFSLVVLLCVRTYEHQLKQAAVTRHHMARVTNSASPITMSGNVSPASEALNRSKL